MNTSAFDRLLFKERTLGSDVGGEFPYPPTFDSNLRLKGASSNFYIAMHCLVNIFKE